MRALAREAGLPVADKRESQDLCFVAGLGGRAFLQRHGGPRAAHARARSSTRDGTRARPPRRPAQLHGRPAARPRRSRAREPLYVLEKDAERATAWSSARRRRSPRTRVPLERRHASTARRDAVETVRLRYHAEPLACRGARPGRRQRSSSSSTRPPNGVAPGQLACLMREDRVVGEGTIGEPR